MGTVLRAQKTPKNMLGFSGWRAWGTNEQEADHEPAMCLWEQRTAS